MSRWCLGDNLFYGQGFQKMLRREAARQKPGATVFAYTVKSPEQYGVVELDPQGMAISLEEKPARPKSKLAVTGLYFYDNQVARPLPPACDPRRRAVNWRLPTSIASTWCAAEAACSAFHAASPGSIRVRMNRCCKRPTSSRPSNSGEASKVACIEEVAYYKGFITAEQLEALGRGMKNSYGQYLLNLLADAKKST